ncbi:MAG: hypothetical protein P8Y42_22100, partial [Exilibacterium sp.]
IFGPGPLRSFYSSIFRAVLNFSNPHIGIAMLRLEKTARDPENTALKGPVLENLCNDRVKALQKVVGDDLATGVVLYNGLGIVPFGQHLYAVPYASLWAFEEKHP